MHSSRMRTACSSGRLGGRGSPPGTPVGADPFRPGTTPWEQTPQEQTPPSRAPLDAETPDQAHPLLQGMLGYHLQCMLGYHPPR